MLWNQERRQSLCLSPGCSELVENDVGAEGRPRPVVEVVGDEPAQGVGELPIDGRQEKKTNSSAYTTARMPLMVALARNRHFKGSRS